MIFHEALLHADVSMSRVLLNNDLGLRDINKNTLIRKKGKEVRSSLR